MQKAIGTTFILAWLLCGCSVDQMFDDPRAAWTVVVSLVVIVISAWLITRSDN